MSSVFALVFINMSIKSRIAEIAAADLPFLKL